MYEIIILPVARDDIKEAFDWYNTRKKGLGLKFTSQVRQKIKRIGLNPYDYAIRYDDIRTAVLDVFPFMIHYYLDESKKSILISAVLHTSRNPELWESR